MEVELGVSSEGGKGEASSFLHSEVCNGFIFPLPLYEKVGTPWRPSP
jgi:hypothetical protein